MAKTPMKPTAKAMKAYEGSAADKKADAKGAMKMMARRSGGGTLPGRKDAIGTYSTPKRKMEPTKDSDTIAVARGGVVKPRGKAC